MSPAVSFRAVLQSIMPAPVFSRRSLHHRGGNGRHCDRSCRAVRPSGAQMKENGGCIVDAAARRKSSSVRRLDRGCSSTGASSEAPDRRRAPWLSDRPSSDRAGHQGHNRARWRARRRRWPGSGTDRRPDRQLESGDRDDRDVELAGLGDGDGFLVRVDHEQEVNRPPISLMPPSERSLLAVALTPPAPRAGQADRAGVEHLLAQALDRVGDRLPVGQVPPSQRWLT